jgi:DNA invertase Pin-like site-specific DNA recombinase
MDVVATYTDSGKSALTLVGRQELKTLLDEAESRRADFRVVLVYDVCRRGVSTTSTKVLVTSTSAGEQVLMSTTARSSFKTTVVRSLPSLRV